MSVNACLAAHADSFDYQVAGKMFISGQIPLVPATLSLHGGSFAEQAVLALQHLRRIAASAQNRTSARAQSCICWLGPSPDDATFAEKVCIARQAWRTFDASSPP